MIRKILIVVVILVVLLLILVGLAPTMISAGLGKGIIISQIESALDAKADYAALGVSWFGNQSIDDFELTTTTGDPIATIDASASVSLVSLITGSATSIAVEVGGTITEEFRADGTTRIGSIVRPDPSPKPAPPSSGPALAGLPALTITITNLDVDLLKAYEGEDVSLYALHGTATIGRGQPLTVDLAGRTSVGGSRADLALVGQVNNLVSAAGDLTPTLANGSVKADFGGVPVRLGDQRVVLDGATMVLASSDPTRSVDLTIGSTIAMGDRRDGRLDASVTLERFMDALGNVRVRGDSAVNVTAALTNVPLDVEGRRIDLQSLNVDVKGPKATERIDVGVTMRGRIDGAEASVLDANLALTSPLREGEYAPGRLGQALAASFDGSRKGLLQLDPANIVGAATGRNVPTAILQPLVAGTPLDLAKDVGPIADLDASLPGGAGGDITLAVRGANLDLRTVAAVDLATMAVDGRSLALRTAVRPALLEHYAGITAATPAQVELDLTRFVVPAAAADGRLPLERLGASGRLRMPTPLTLPAVGERRILETVRDIDLTFDAPSLGERVVVKGGAAADGAIIAVDQTVTNLLDAAGAPNLEGVMPVGRITISEISAALLARVLPEQADLVAAAVPAPGSVTIETAGDAGGLRATTTVRLGALSADLAATRRGDGLALHESTVRVDATPALVAMLQKDASSPIAIRDTVPVTVTLPAASFPKTGASAWDFTSAPLAARVTIPGATVLNVPGLTGEATVGAVSSDITLPLDADFAIAGDIGARTTIETATFFVGESTPGGVLLRNVDVTVALAPSGDVKTAGRSAVRLASAPGAGVGVLTFDGGVGMGEAGVAPDVSFQLADVKAQNLERLLGLEPDAVGAWVGAAGTASGRFAQQGQVMDASVALQFDRLDATATAKTDDRYLVITADVPKMVVDHRRLNAMLAASAADVPAERREAPGVHLTQDVTVSPVVKTIRLPREIIDGKPLHPELVNIDVEVRAGAVPVASASGFEAVVDALVATVKSQDLAKGVNFTLNGETRVPKENDPGSLAVDGKVTNLVNDQGVFTPDDLRITADVNAPKVPTAIVGLFTEVAPVVEASLGPRTTLKANLRNYSSTSGTIDVDLSSANSTLKATVSNNGRIIRIPKSAEPLKARLTVSDAMRELVLKPIHPLLGDVRPRGQIDVTMDSLNVPLNGDLKRLRSDVLLKIGELDIDRRSLFLSILSLGESPNAKTVPGRIDDITVKIRDGIVTYDRFNVSVGNITMGYNGSVDLAARTIDLRTEVPLQSLAADLVPKEIKAFRYIGNDPIPVRFTGSMDKPKLKVDDVVFERLLKSLAEDAIKKGLGKPLEDLIGGGGKTGGGGG
ncbi:MAG: hypothetical protein KDA25_07770 [Phycisphaerales bacterium]|nr:hypothetical protein [Phycisphaerales bacterium]